MGGATSTIRKLKGKEKTLQTIHKPYILLFISLIIRVLQNVWFVLQTIHKLYINYTLKRSKPYTKRRVNPTKNGAQTLHKTLHKKLYILFFEHESCEGSKCAVSCGDASRNLVQVCC